MPVIDEYVQASVNTAGPWKLHLMVVDRALSHARSVVKLLELRMFEDAHLEAGRSREFIVEIISAMRSDAAPGLVASVKEYSSRPEGAASCRPSAGLCCSRASG
jgi:flagellin-specific chaperone FliS